MGNADANRESFSIKELLHCIFQALCHIPLFFQTDLHHFCVINSCCEIAVVYELPQLTHQYLEREKLESGKYAVKC